jgi:quercetin dioxygenase-like cupin family protein
MTLKEKRVTMLMRASMFLLMAMSLTAQQSHTNEARFVPLRPLTADFEVISGDPEAAGQPFVMRIRELPGTVIPPHSHPVDEHLTVLQGTFLFAVSDKFDLSLLKELKAGGYAFAPKGSTMFGASPDGAIVQVHGVGPFHIHWRDGLKTLDDPAAQDAFRFRKGDPVVGSRGPGKILKGYASGSHVQYEVELMNGPLVMESEAALRRTVQQ